MTDLRQRLAAAGNTYFSPERLDRYNECPPEVLRAAQLQAQGQLTEYDVPWCAPPGMHWTDWRQSYEHEKRWQRQGLCMVPRWHYIARAGFAVCTVEWMDSRPGCCARCG